MKHIRNPQTGRNFCGRPGESLGPPRAATVAELGDQLRQPVATRQVCWRCAHELLDLYLAAENAGKI